MHQESSTGILCEISARERGIYGQIMYSQLFQQAEYISQIILLYLV